MAQCRKRYSYIEDALIWHYGSIMLLNVESRLESPIPQYQIPSGMVVKRNLRSTIKNIEHLLNGYIHFS